jgi:hypothetical protein
MPQEVATAGLNTKTFNKGRNAHELRYFNGVWHSIAHRIASHSAAQRIA